MEPIANGHANPLEQSAVLVDVERKQRVVDTVTMNGAMDDEQLGASPENAPAEANEDADVDDTGEEDRDPVLAALYHCDWAALRTLSVRPGGFGTARRRAWPFLLHVNVEDALADPAPESITNGADSGFRRRRRRASSDACSTSEEDAPRRAVQSDCDVDGGDVELTESTQTHPDEQPHPDEHQIKLDTDRSFVLYPEEGDSPYERARLQAELNALITTLFRRWPQLSYFQGYHDILTVLFLTLPPSLQLPSAEKMSLHRLRDSMGRGLEPMLGLLRILKYLFRLIDPDLAALLERTNHLPYFALSNLLTLFAHDVPTLPLIQHVFDYLLCRPPIAAVYLVAAVTLTHKDEAVRMEEEGEEGMLHSVFTRLPEMVDGDEEPDEEGIVVDLSASADVLTESILDVRPEHLSDFTPDGPASNEPNGIPDHLQKTPAEVEEEALEQLSVCVNVPNDSDAPNPLISRSRTSSSSSRDLASTPGEPEDSVRSQDVSPPEDPDDYVQTQVAKTNGYINGPAPGVVIDEDRQDDANHLSPDTPPDTHPAESDSIVDLTASQPPLPPSSPSPSTSSSTSFSPGSSPTFYSPPLPSTSASASTRLDSKPARKQTYTQPRTPSRPRLALSQILADADELLVRYPPEHPELHVKEIMGPNSVVHSWSENGLALLADADAAVFAKTSEGVVLPYVDPEEEEEGVSKEAETDSGTEWDEKERKALQKRSGRAMIHAALSRLLALYQLTLRKGRRHPTLSVGALLVLGVALTFAAVHARGEGVPRGSCVGLGLGGWQRLWEHMISWRGRPVV